MIVTRVSAADPTFTGIWTSVFYILVGAIAVQCGRQDISAPSRGKLLACIILNGFVTTISLLGVALLILVWISVNNNAGSGKGYTRNNVYYSTAITEWGSCYDSVMVLLKALLSISLINLLAAIPVSITATVLATKMRKTTSLVTFTTITPSAPPIVGPVVSAGYSVAPLMPPSYHSYDTTTQHAGPGYVIHVDVAK